MDGDSVIVVFEDTDAERFVKRDEPGGRELAREDHLFLPESHPSHVICMHSSVS
jgi:hypothetical protein